MSAAPGEGTALRAVDPADGAWLNPPAAVRAAAGGFTAVTGRGGDFWRHTHYGFVRDSGHFFAVPVGPAFTAEVHVAARYEHLYDQAGLMVRAGPDLWAKAGVEFSDGRARLAAVVTAGRSDWSLSAPDFDPGAFWLRMTLRDDALRVQASADRRTWTLLRLAPFAAGGRALEVGPMCCTPERAGLAVTFTGFGVGPATAAGLHDTGA